MNGETEKAKIETGAGYPVSNLVKDVLDDTFKMVNNVGYNVGILVSDVLEDVEHLVDGVKNARKKYLHPGN
jgi:hypothetical protein